MDDKQLFYQMLEREIDNIISRSNPMVSMMAQPIKTYVFNFIDPYVSLFFMGTTDFKAEVAGDFIKNEMNNRINNFIENYNNEKNRT